MLLCESPTLTPIHRRILMLAFLGWMFDFYDLILYTFLTRPITAELGLTKMDHAQALGRRSPPPRWAASPAAFSPIATGGAR